MHYDLARAATIVARIDAATPIVGAIRRRVGAASARFDSLTTRLAVASTASSAKSSVVRRGHRTATNSAPFPRVSTADPETDRGSNPAAGAHHRPNRECRRDIWMHDNGRGEARADGVARAWDRWLQSGLHAQYRRSGCRLQRARRDADLRRERGEVALCLGRQRTATAHERVEPRRRGCCRAAQAGRHPAHIRSRRPAMVVSVAGAPR